MATDYDCWRDSNDCVNVADVLKIFNHNVEKITKLLIKTVELIGQEDWKESIKNAKVLKSLNHSIMDGDKPAV